MKHILFTTVLLLVAGIAYAGDNDRKILHQFLYSKNLTERNKAFNHIITNKNNLKNIVLAELQSFSKKSDNTPDGLIYLAAFLKDRRFIQPLATLLNNADYSLTHCIYSCPIVFSLVIFCSFTDYPLPTFDDSLTAVHDLKSEAEMVKDISIKPEEASKYMVGPVVDEPLRQMEKLPLAAVIEIAGPKTKDSDKRMIAAVVLQAHVTNDKYLKELYWLATTGLPNDASAEYRNSIHWAIYRAEKYKRQKSHSNAFKPELKKSR